MLNESKIGSVAQVAQPVDRNILQEIVRIVEARRKVPERVQVRAREYLITYLEDHQRRLQEALQRYDSDRLNMLYGQLASKVKYQLLRRVPGRAAAETRAAPLAKRSGGKKSAPQKPTRKPAAGGPKRGKQAKGASSRKTAGKKVAGKKVAGKKAPTKKTAPAKKVSPKRSTAKKIAPKKSAAKKTAVTKAAAKKRKTKK